MASRAQIELPVEVTATRQYIPFTEGLNRPLAEDYGSVVTDISNQEDLHTLFAVQAAYMLRHVDPDMNDWEKHVALRVMTRPHKYEEPFWQADTEEPTSAYVLFPYAPPVYETAEDEQKFNQPLHMTFGLLRVAEHVRTARATLWIARDHQSPREGTYRADKYVTAYAEHQSKLDAEAHLQNPMRSAARARIPLARLLSTLE